MTLSPSTAALLASVSDELAAAVARAGRSIVAVHGRRRLPASGVAWRPDLVVTAAHVLERGVELAISLEHDDARVPARLVGYDAGSDLAVLAVDAAAVGPQRGLADEAPIGSALGASGAPQATAGRPAVLPAEGPPVGVTAIGAQGAASDLPAEGQSVGAQSAVSDLPGERAPVGLAAVGARGALAEAPRVDRAGPPERPGARGLVAAERASLDSAGPGSLALAVARPGTPAPMATFGVITSTGGAWRTAMGGVLDAYLRADVALLPGFSGGAIVDVQGRVLGLLSAHLAGGDSMAIPCAVVDRLVQALLSGGVRHRAYLGISTQAVDLQEAVRQSLGLDQGSGLMLLGLEPGGPAERAGLLLGDIVLAIGGRPVIDGEALQMALGPEVVGKLVAVRLVRGGQLVELSVTPGERP